MRWARQACWAQRPRRSVLSRRAARCGSALLGQRAGGTVEGGSRFHGSGVGELRCRSELCGLQSIGAALVYSPGLRTPEGLYCSVRAGRGPEAGAGWEDGHAARSFRHAACGRHAARGCQACRRHAAGNSRQAHAAEG